MANHNLHLSGIVTARTPIMHIDSSSSDKTYAIKTSVQSRDSESGGYIFTEVPYVQGSSMRGRLRDIMADIIASRVEHNGGLLDLETTMRLFSGGQMATKSKEDKNTDTTNAKVADEGKEKAKNPKNANIAMRRDILSRCIDLKLFGGIAGGSMFESSLRVGSLYPVIDETIDAGMVPGMFESDKQDTLFEKKGHDGASYTVNVLTDSWVILKRNDEILDGEHKAIKYLSEEGMTEAEEYIRVGLENQNKKKGNRKNGKTKTDDKKTIQKHFSKIQVIPAGTKLFSEMHLVNVSEETIGLALLTMEKFLKCPYICGGSRAGYGKISVNYALTVDDERPINDFIKVESDGNHSINYDAFGKDCIEAYREFEKHLTAESLKA